MMLLEIRYLDGSMRKVLLNNGAEAWAFSSSHHVRAAVDNVEKHIKKKGISFPKSCDTYLLTSHRPELDITPGLSVEDSAH